MHREENWSEDGEDLVWNRCSVMLKIKFLLLLPQMRWFYPLVAVGISEEKSLRVHCHRVDFQMLFF